MATWLGPGASKPSAAPHARRRQRHEDYEREDRDELSEAAGLLNEDGKRRRKHRQGAASPAILGNAPARRLRFSRARRPFPTISTSSS